MKHCIRFLMVACLAASAGAQEWAKARLEKSPRHGEFITVDSGGRKLSCFIVFPEVKEKAPAVLVIHEIFGLTDWARGVCDQLAEAGYVAIAPDFLSGMGTFSNVDDARKAISQLTPAQVLADADATAKYVRALPAVNGRLAVAGFCWGGGKSFEYAEHNPKVEAAFVFYGSGPETAAAAKPIQCPVFGFYGESDARITSTVATSEKAMKEAGKHYEPVTYTGAGHGFMRLGEAPDASPANAKAREDAWKRWKDLLSKLR